MPTDTLCGQLPKKQKSSLSHFFLFLLLSSVQLNIGDDETAKLAHWISAFIGREHAEMPSAAHTTFKGAI